MKVSSYNHFLEVDGVTYLFNACRRGLHQVDPCVLGALIRLRSGDPIWDAELPVAYRELLEDQGYILADDLDEEQTIVEQRRRITSRKSILSLTIAPTLDCNFACPYCFEHEKAPIRMTRGTMEAIVAFAKSQCSHETKHLVVTWFGGEPLLALPQIQELTYMLRDEFAASHGLQYSAGIITNGYGLTKRISEMLSNLNVYNAQVTIDGTAETHDARRFLKRTGAGTFSRIMDNLSEASEILQVWVRCNLDASNLKAFPSLAKVLADNLPRVTFYPAFTRDSGVDPWSPAYCDIPAFHEAQVQVYEEFPWLGEKLFPFPVARRQYCEAQVDMSWTISPTGELYRCWEMIADPKYAVGSVFTGIDDAASAYWLNWGTDSPKCKDCRLTPLCMGGCAAQALRNNGEPQCGVSRIGIESAIRVLAQRSRET